MALETTRYCPRCDANTLWSNEADESLTLACSGTEENPGCGLTVTTQLTREEQERSTRHEARRPARFRRRYEFV